MTYATDRFAVRINIDVMVFVGVLVAGLILLDYVPWTRPRQIVIGPGVESLRDVAKVCQRGSTSTTDTIAQRMAAYNELTARISAIDHADLFDGTNIRVDRPLLIGLLLELPPRV